LLRHKTTLRLAITLALATLMLGFPNIRSPAEESGGSSSDGSSSIEKLFAPVLVWQSQPGLRVGNFSSAIRNLVAAAARKHEIDTETAEIRVDAAESATTFPIKFKSGNTNGGISTPSVTASRFTGFTQSETSAAWCGNSVLVAFNDTAAEITTLAGGSGISSIGFSSSSSAGSKFDYMGAPTLAASALQMLAGDPVVVCADAKTFYYSSTWMDGLATVSGIAVAQSTDGGATFSAPTAAVAMPSSSHIISRGWLTIDSSRPSHLYLAYDDFDFSGAVCGTNISGQATLGYAVELVTSTDGANTWSAPVVVEEVCQDSVSPSASVLNPQAVVDQQGTVYVVWEAIGEDGGTLTTREIKVASSTTEGASFSSPVEIAAVTPIGNGADLQSFIHQFESPSIAIGKGPHDTGFVYVAWSNAATTAPDRLSTTGLYGFSDVVFSDSTSGGASWSNPVRVNNNVENPSAPSDQFEPAIGADKTGKIVVCFYDRRRDVNNFLIDRYCGTSTNAGVKWTNTRVTSTTFAPMVGEDALVAPDYAGEYDAVVSDGLNSKSGLLTTYASNAPGNPTVMLKKF
jgi:hypothetical protein